MREQRHAVRGGEQTGGATRLPGSPTVSEQGYRGRQAPVPQARRQMSAAATWEGEHKRPGEEVAAGRLVGPAATNDGKGDGTNTCNGQRVRALQFPEIGPGPEGHGKLVKTNTGPCLIWNHCLAACVRLYSTWHLCFLFPWVVTASRKHRRSQSQLLGTHGVNGISGMPGAA